MTSPFLSGDDSGGPAQVTQPLLQDSSVYIPRANPEPGVWKGLRGVCTGRKHIGETESPQNLHLPRRGALWLWSKGSQGVFLLM